MVKKHHKHHYPLGVPGVTESAAMAMHGAHVPGVTDTKRHPLPRLTHSPIDGTHHYGERELYGTLKKKVGRY